MRIMLMHRRALGRLVVAGAAMVAPLLFRGTLRAEEAPSPAAAPSLADAIAFESADVWNGATPTPVVAPPGGVEPVSAETACSTCGGDGAGMIYPYNRCGCSSHALFPWFSGPGRCDAWCVGPHWEVAADGLILFREGTDFAAIPPVGGFVETLTDDFDYAPGARLFVTGYNDLPFGIQVGYEGVNDFHANALYQNGAGDTRAVTYESNLNSIEVNFVRRTAGAWRPFFGARYIELDDDFVDFTTVNKPVPAPADPPAAPVAFVDTGRSEFLDNRLIGMQGGAFRDVWRLNRWLTIEPFGNAGVYLNDFKRENVTRNVTTVINGDDLSTVGSEYSQTTTDVTTITKQEIAELAFVGEAGITGVIRLSPCVALRGGWQVLAVNGVGQGLDALVAPGLDPATLVYHGGHFGIEYVR